MREIAFKIQGMDCAEEVTLLKREVGPLVGGADRLAFDVLSGKMTVFGSPAPSEDEIRDAVARAGMRAEAWREVDVDTAATAVRGPNWRVGLVLTSGLLTAAGLVAQLAGPGLGHEPPPLAVLLYAIGTISGAWFVLPKAWLALRRARPDMNLLMTVAIAGAMVLGEWFEASTVAFLFGLSLMLESWSIGRARRAIARLMDLTPRVASVLDDHGSEREVPLDDVAVGSRILVRPGQRLPLDGVVTHGASDVNQAPITGESLPVSRGAGDPVFAGSINGAGALEIRTTKPASDTTLARIIRLVGEAQHNRAPAEQWVDRFARIYTPVVMGLALVVCVVPPVVFAAAWAPWIYRGLVLLVIACPCALVISTPVSIVAAIAAAARHGVLIKGGLYVELPAGLRAVAIDKTGTLTTGRPEVVDVILHDEKDEATFLRRAAALEARSEHPLARAVVAYVADRGISVVAAGGYRAVPGKGGWGVVDGQSFWIGSHRLLAEQGLETPAIREHIDRFSASGRSVLAVGTSSRVCGFLAVADTVRAGARDSVRALHAAGLEHVVMLTGDNEPTARAIAAATGVDEYRAELLPEDKVAAVTELVDRYGQVAMVGDGVNDAPALARASLGVAMGVAGSDATLETSDVALMSDDLSKLAWLVLHSRRTLRIIRQNIAFSLGVKAVFVVLTFAGFATLWGAIAADMGASLLVIFNGLRLLRAGAE
jgi:Cd2+/Zn2+-exporting ATPase